MSGLSELEKKSTGALENLVQVWNQTWVLGKVSIFQGFMLIFVKVSLVKCTYGPESAKCLIRNASLIRRHKFPSAVKDSDSTLLQQ